MTCYMIRRLADASGRHMQALLKAPTKLRQVRIEASTLKIVLDRVEYLARDSLDLQLLEGEDGTLARSRRATESLLKLFPQHSEGNTASSGKRRRDDDEATIRERFKWAWNKKSAEKLLEELRNHRETMVLLLEVDSV